MKSEMKSAEAPDIVMSYKAEGRYKMSESSLIVSIQNDIGEINANMMRVNRSAVFLNNNKIEVAMLEHNLLFAKVHIAIALKHLDLLEAL